MIFLPGFKGLSASVAIRNDLQRVTLKVSEVALLALRVLLSENPPSTEEALCCREDLPADMSFALTSLKAPST